MNFLLDENLPPRSARALKGLLEEPHNEVFHLAADLQKGGTPDRQWLSGLNPAQRWAIITHDPNIRTRPQELAAWKEHGHVIFFLAQSWSHQTFHEQAWRLVRWWPTIVQTALRAKPRDAFLVPFKGSPSRLKRLPVHSKRRRG